VGAIPEGLPVAITVALAVATTRMARIPFCGLTLPRLPGSGHPSREFSGYCVEVIPEQHISRQLSHG